MVECIGPNGCQGCRKVDDRGARAVGPTGTRITLGGAHDIRIAERVPGKDVERAPRRGVEWPVEARARKLVENVEQVNRAVERDDAARIRQVDLRHSGSLGLCPSANRRERSPRHLDELGDGAGVVHAEQRIDELNVAARLDDKLSIARRAGILKVATDKEGRPRRHRDLRVIKAARHEPELALARSRHVDVSAERIRVSERARRKDAILAAVTSPDLPQDVRAVGDEHAMVDLGEIGIRPETQARAEGVDPRIDGVEPFCATGAAQETRHRSRAGTGTHQVDSLQSGSRAMHAPRCAEVPRQECRGTRVRPRRVGNPLAHDDDGCGDGVGVGETEIAGRTVERVGASDSRSGEIGQCRRECRVRIVARTCAVG